MQLDLRQRIAKTLRDGVFPLIASRRASVFLGGAGKSGAPTARSVRHTLARELRGAQYRIGERSFSLDVYQPEELFTRLVYGPRPLDLLQLENLLALSVDAVVLVLEGAGSIAELGAFSNYEGLRDRLVVIVSEKHHRDMSFIRLGPLRYLQLNTESRVIYYDFTAPLDRLVRSVRDRVREYLQQRERRPLVSDLLSVRDFLLPAVYVLGEARDAELREIMHAATTGPADTSALVGTGMGMLLDHGLVASSAEGWVITRPGMESLLGSRAPTRTVRRTIEPMLDGLRVDVLNYRRRVRRKEVQAGSAHLSRG